MAHVPAVPSTAPRVLTVALLLAACLAARPGTVLAQAASQAPHPRPIEVPFEQFTLPNGLHVILHQDRSVPVITLNVWYHVGSGSEKPGRTGFAHLF